MKTKNQFRELLFEKGGTKAFFVEIMLDLKSSRSTINLENYLKNKCINDLLKEIKLKRGIETEKMNYTPFFNLDIKDRVQAILILFPEKVDAPILE